MRIDFQRPIKAVLPLILAVITLAACSTGLSVRSDEDPNAEFGRYSTWGFFNELGIEGGNNSPVFGEHFRAAITREMNARGYRQAEDPDLYVNVTLRADDKVKMKSHTAPYTSGAYYHRPGSRYYGSSMAVGVGTVSRATEVTEASIFIDLVDNSSDRLVWQGVAVAEATDSAAKRLRDAVYTAVERVFNLYPYTAGQ